MPPIYKKITVDECVEIEGQILDAFLTQSYIYYIDVTEQNVLRKRSLKDDEQHESVSVMIEDISGGILYEGPFSERMKTIHVMISVDKDQNPITATYLRANSRHTEVHASEIDKQLHVYDNDDTIVYNPFGGAPFSYINNGHHLVSCVCKIYYIPDRTFIWFQ